MPTESVDGTGGGEFLGVDEAGHHGAERRALDGTKAGGRPGQGEHHPGFGRSEEGVGQQRAGAGHEPGVGDEDQAAPVHGVGQRSPQEGQGQESTPSSPTARDDPVSWNTWYGTAT
jgi:hypothetical protein